MEIPNGVLWAALGGAIIATGSWVWRVESRLPSQATDTKIAILEQWKQSHLDAHNDKHATYKIDVGDLAGLRSHAKYSSGSSVALSWTAIDDSDAGVVVFSPIFSPRDAGTPDAGEIDGGSRPIPIRSRGVP